MKIELCCLLLLLLLSSQVSLLAESPPICYNYTANQSIHKIGLCLTAGRSNSSQQHALGVITDRSIDDISNSPLFCSPNSAVNKYFTLVSLRIPSEDGSLEDIERSCDVVISAGDSSVSFYNAFHKAESSPLVLAYPLINRNIFLEWSDVVAWRLWMTKRGFSNYITKQVDLQNPTYPLVLREALSEIGRGQVHVIKTPEELMEKVQFFRERRVAFLAEELLGDSMGHAQHGAFYVTAYEGRVLNLQGYVLAEENNSSTSAPEGGVSSVHHRIKFELEVTNLISRITKRARYTGVYCAYYKLNDQHQIVFVQFSALMCPLLRRRSDCFLEAYLPLTFAIHRHLRIAQGKSPSPRLSAIIARSDAWFRNKTLSDLSHGFQMHSKASLDMHAPLPTVSDLVLKAVGFAEVR